MFVICKNILCQGLLYRSSIPHILLTFGQDIEYHSRYIEGLTCN